jgi:hypothetical protein
VNHCQASFSSSCTYCIGNYGGNVAATLTFDR